MEEWSALVPTEGNAYCLFAGELERDPLVLFHATPHRHKDSIVCGGFQSASSLGVGELQSVSYAKKSSTCLAYVGRSVSEDYVVFAVRFESLDRVANNESDIHVYDHSIQPKILGFCVLKAGFRIA